MRCRHSSKDSSEFWHTHLRHGREAAPVSLQVIAECMSAGRRWLTARGERCPLRCIPAWVASPPSQYDGSKERPRQRTLRASSQSGAPGPMPGQWSQSASCLPPSLRLVPSSWEAGNNVEFKAYNQNCHWCKIPVLFILPCHFHQILEEATSPCFSCLLRWDNNIFFHFAKPREISECKTAMDRIKDCSAKDYIKEISGHGCFPPKNNYKLNQVSFIYSFYPNSQQYWPVLMIQRW